MAKFFDITPLKKENKETFMSPEPLKEKFYGMIFYVLIVLTLLGGITFIAAKFSLNTLNPSTKKDAKQEFSTPTPTQTSSILETPTPEATAAPTDSDEAVVPAATPPAEVTPETIATPEPTSTNAESASDKADYKIRIISSFASQAALKDVKTKLTNAGYKINDTVAVTKRYSGNFIYYKQGKKAVAEDIAKILSSYKPTLDQSVSTTIDVSIVIVK